MRHKETYKRIEKVLAEDTLSVTPRSIGEIEDAVKQRLSEYMDICDMHISFKRLEGSRYAIKIEGIASNMRVPNII